MLFEQLGIDGGHFACELLQEHDELSMVFDIIKMFPVAVDPAIVIFNLKSLEHLNGS